MPKVSVIIPTYNRAALLRRSIQSVLNQTYQDFEIIVVDDASTDSTKEVVEGFKDRRMKYIRHKDNRGEAAARNTGIKCATGEYIASHDSDDEWLPEKLERQVKIFENASLDLGVVYTEYLRIINGKKIHFRPPEAIKRGGGVHRTELLSGNFIGTPTTLIKKECFEKAGMFDENLPHLVDWEMWLRISKFYEFKYINEPLVLVYYTADSVSAKPHALIAALEMILQKHYEDFAKDRKILAKYLYWMGSLLCQIGEMQRGRKNILKGIRLDPLNIRYLSAIFISLLGKGAYRKVAEINQQI